MSLVPIDPKTGKPVPKKDREKFLNEEKRRLNHDEVIKDQLAAQSVETDVEADVETDVEEESNNA